jgi:deazaflavin-dependent oxidoreductase (nitroreductase family)
MTATQSPTQHRYVEPGRFTRRVFNPLMAVLTRRGLSIRGSRVLAVRGRTSGEWKRVPVNPLDLDGHRYLVAPRGTTQWVRNLRVAKTGELRVGRKVEVFRAVEVADTEKVAILRRYLERWKMEVGVFFDGVGPDAPDAEIAAIAPGYPVFEIQPA